MPSDATPGFFRRLVTSDSDLEASQLDVGRQQRGAASAATCDRGGIVDLYGRLRAVQHIPGSATSSQAVEAELFDGSGSVTLVWLGRSVIGGIAAGAQLRVHGRIALREGRRVIFNPSYTLEADR